MKRYLDDRVLKDLATKIVVLTGPRQVGKTTLARQLMQGFGNAQYLNWDVLPDRVVLQRQSWNPRARLLVMDEIHEMRNWKGWLKGVVDGRSPMQALLVTGSARMDTFRQGGIRWRAVIFPIACIRFRCASGASKKPLSLPMRWSICWKGGARALFGRRRNASRSLACAVFQRSDS